MLHVYYNRTAIPADKTFVFDVEELTDAIDLAFDSITVDIIREVDKAEVIDSYTFKDQFGIGMHREWLSTTAKILLCVHQLDIVINGYELGDNGMCILSEFPNGNVLLNPYSFDLKPNVFPIFVNDTICYNRDEFENAVLEVIP